MKNKRTMVAIVSALWAISTVCAFAIGLSVGQRGMLSSSEVALQNIQAKLLFNRIEDDRDLGSLMNKGCVTVASEFVAYTTDRDMLLMHDFLLEPKMGDAVSYIKYRNPEILKQAAAYSPRFPNPWIERPCN